MGDVGRIAITTGRPVIFSKPESVALVSRDRDVYVAGPALQRVEAGETETRRYVLRDRLETLYPGVLFRGALIFVEEGTLIAPGVILDTDDRGDHFGRIEIRGESAVASGTVLRGDVTVEKSRLRSGSFVGGVVHLSGATIGRGASVMGNHVLVYRSLVLGSVSGETIRLDRATVSRRGSLVGSNIVVHSDEVIAAAEIGSNRQFGEPGALDEEETVLAAQR